MASVLPSAFGGRHQPEAGTPRLWWLRALNSSQRNWKYFCSDKWNSLDSVVSAFQNAGIRPLGGRVPMFPNTHQLSRVATGVTPSARYPVVAALIMAGSEPNGASKAAGLYHCVSCCWRVLLLRPAAGFPIRFGRQLMPSQAPEVKNIGTPDWIFQFWVRFHPPRSLSAQPPWLRNAWPLPKGSR